MHRIVQVWVCPGQFSVPLQLPLQLLGFPSNVKTLDPQSSLETRGLTSKNQPFSHVFLSNWPFSGRFGDFWRFFGVHLGPQEHISP